MPAVTLSWGEYVLGLALKAADQPQEAWEIFVRLARDPAVPEGRRAYAGWEAASLLQKSDPAEATKLLLETLHCENDVRAQQYTLLAELLLQQGRGDELSTQLQTLLAEPSPQLDEILAALGQSATDLLAGDDPARGRELVRRLEDAARGGKFADRADKALGEARSQMNALATTRFIQTHLKDFLAQHPLPADDPSRPETSPKADRAELTREMNAKDADGATEVSLRDGLELLTGFPPDKDFSRVLWQTAAFADWRERTRPQPVDGALLDELLNLCDRLPATDHNRYEGQFLRAKRLERLHDLPGALRLYTGLRDDPALPVTFQGALHDRLGKALESQGDLRGALAVYRDVETEAANLPSAADSLLRAAFIHLSFNERPEAFRLFDLLAKVDAATLDKAATARQIKELVALTRDHAKAEAYWNDAARWSGQWHDFLRDTAPELLADDDRVVPAIADLTEWGRQIGQAARDKDQVGTVRAFRIGVHAARWQPGMTIEVGDIALHGGKFLPADFVGPVRRLVIAIGEGYALDASESSRKNQVMLTTNLLDGNQADRALEITTEFRRRDGTPGDKSALAMTRIWALSVQQTGGDVGPAITALEEQLASPALAADRSSTVSILAQLYIRAGRTSDEEKLLAREVDNPVIKGSAEASRVLGDRLTALRGEGSASAKFSQTVAHWLETHRPAWYDYAGPKDLNDPKLADTEAFLRTPPTDFTKAEIIKGQMLIACDAAQPLDRKTSAWHDAVHLLLQLCQTNQQARELVDSILEEPGFSENVRTTAVFAAMSAADEKMQAAEFAHWSHDPLAAKFNEAGRAARAALRVTLDACASNSAAEVEAAGRLLLQKPVGASELHALSQTFGRCLSMQAFPEAERLSKLAATMEVKSGVKQTRASVQLDFLRRLREAQRWAPVQSELRRLTLEHFAPETIERPAVLDQWCNGYALDDLPARDAQAVRLWQLQTWNWNEADLRFWRALIRQLPPDPAGQELAQRLQVAMLRLTTSDPDRAEAVETVQNSTDSDDPGLRQWLAETLKPYHDTRWPETYAAVRMGEIRIALRVGEPIDLVSELESVQNSPVVKRYGQHLSVQHYLQKKDTVRLKTALDALSPEELLRREGLPVNIPALELVDRADEATLARETARTELTRAFLKSWSEGSGTEATLVYRLLAQLPESDPARAIPDHWLEGCLGLIRDERTALSLRMHDAHFRKDWPTLAAVAAEAVAAFPTVYAFYYYQGEALYALGRKEEARHPLEIFVQYSKNDQEYDEAQGWLREISTVSSR